VLFTCLAVSVHGPVQQVFVPAETGNLFLGVSPPPHALGTCWWQQPPAGSGPVVSAHLGDGAHT
jgi:hypothetical protein